jgi:hypothetical protein
MTIAIAAIIALDVAVVGALALVMRSAMHWGSPARETQQRALATRPASRTAPRRSQEAIRAGV